MFVWIMLDRCVHIILCVCVCAHVCTSMYAHGCVCLCAHRRTPLSQGAYVGGHTRDDNESVIWSEDPLMNHARWLCAHVCKVEVCVCACVCVKSVTECCTLSTNEICIIMHRIIISAFLRKYERQWFSILWFKTMKNENKHEKCVLLMATDWFDP